MMTIGSILLGLALLIVVALYLSRPFLLAKPQTASSPGQRLQLEQRKEALLSEIRALDFDRETGNIPDEVYEQQRAQLMYEASAVMKTLDEMPDVEGGDVYSQIEVAINERRHYHVPSSNGQAGYCTQCGQSLEQDDKFCARCGQSIRAVQPTV